jgi:hypothetical protein
VKLYSAIVKDKETKRNGPVVPTEEYMRVVRERDELIKKVRFEKMRLKLISAIIEEINSRMPWLFTGRSISSSFEV